MGCAGSAMTGHTRRLSMRKRSRQKHIMSPEFREDAHEGLRVTLAACSLKGWRQTQEDTSSIVINLGGKKDMLGVGVFDGHSGPQASRYVAAHIWDQVTKTAEWDEGDVDGALRAGFLNVDANMRQEKVCHGTTAVVAVITPGYLYVANCGDSRAVLSKGGAASALSTDHKPSLYTEKARVLRCGGQVMVGEFGGVARVTAPGAMVAMATSRSLGDFHFKRGYNSEPGEQVVSPSADVTCVRRSDDDEFLILGTDGVWDVLNNQEVCDMMGLADRAPRPVHVPPVLEVRSAMFSSGAQQQPSSLRPSGGVQVLAPTQEMHSSPVAMGVSASRSASLRRSFSLEPTGSLSLTSALHRGLYTGTAPPAVDAAAASASAAAAAESPDAPACRDGYSCSTNSAAGPTSGDHAGDAIIEHGGRSLSSREKLGQGPAAHLDGSPERDESCRLERNGTSNQRRTSFLSPDDAADAAAAAGAASPRRTFMPPPGGGNGPGGTEDTLTSSSAFTSGEGSTVSSACSNGGPGVPAESSRCPSGAPGEDVPAAGFGGGVGRWEAAGATAGRMQVTVPPLRAVSGESNNYGSGNSWRGGPFGAGSRSAAWWMSHSRRGSGSNLSALFKSNGSTSRDSDPTGVSASGASNRQSGVMVAAREVLDKALSKGSQDNMTIIAVDLRGFAVVVPVAPTTPLQ